MRPARQLRGSTQVGSEGGVPMAINGPLMIGALGVNLEDIGQSVSGVG
jgi:hypothetical protein